VVIGEAAGEVRIETVAIRYGAGNERLLNSAYRAIMPEMQTSREARNNKTPLSRQGKRRFV
jgi:hypothetical protein